MALIKEKPKLGDIDKRVEKDMKFIFGQLDDVTIDNIEVDGLTIRAGTKLLKLEVISSEPISIEEEIRKEYKEKLHSRIQTIREKINTKISELQNFVQGIKREYDRKERDLKDKLARATPMPDVFYKHAEKGLSLVKGQNADHLIWFVQGIYWPQYVDQKPLDAKFSKKMLSNVVFQIETSGDQVTSVTTRMPIGLKFFSHYHQSKPDCWGKWKFHRKWESPSDIVKVAREAEAVLSNINTGSIAEHSPSGLPRKATVFRHVLKDEESKKKNSMGTLNQNVRRAGITTNTRVDDPDVWTA
jgi:hypothetical protein